jgi:hypothetical protein
MNKQKLLIGTELDSFSRTIELSFISRLNAVFNQSGSFSLVGTNLEHTYPAFLLGNLINMSKIYKLLNVHINNILLSRESIISHKPIHVGDIIKVHTLLRDIYEQQASNNPIGFIILETMGLKNNDAAFYAERVYAVRGGFQRGRSL